MRPDQFFWVQSNRELAKQNKERRERKQEDEDLEKKKGQVANGIGSLDILFLVWTFDYFE